MTTDNTPTDPTTHDRLRAALERLVDEAQAMRGNHGHRRTCDRDHSAVPNPSGTYHSCRTLTDAIHDARAALATLAPAADDARTRPHEPECPGGYTGWECFCGAAHTPAPPATEPSAALVDAFLSKLVMHERSWAAEHIDAIVAAARAEATEPVAALVEHYQHTVRVVLMPDGAASLWCRSCDQYLDTPPAARAEVDVERLRRAVLVAGSGRFGAGWDSHAVEDLVVAIAAAYREVEP